MANTSKRFIGAVEDEWQLYSDNASDYTLGAPIGFGASSIVYTALYNPKPPQKPIPCALKVLDLDSLPQHSLRLLKRETTLMSLSKHPNVLRVRGSWMDGHKLYIALRLMNKGSAADVMRYGWPGGMDEEVVRCILKQALEGLNYLHINGFIHRDVKAANMLIDDDGTVLLGDLGVAANLADDTDHHHAPKRAVNFDPSVKTPGIGKRKSFVGTPCWMAPEIIQGHQYDSSADIWSFGITALELTQGRPPRSRETPQKVLLKTVQDAPPTLDRNGGQYKYSRAFKEIIESCLNKDPSLRPTAAQLLSMPFFKSAKKKSSLVGPNGILSGLPPLTQRQERRVATTPGLSIKTVDSWDFTTTTGHGRSPTTSVTGRSPTINTLSGKASGGRGHGHVRGSTGSTHSHRISPTTSALAPLPPSIRRTLTVDGDHLRGRMFGIEDEDGSKEDRSRDHSRAVSLTDGDTGDYESPPHAAVAKAQSTLIPAILSNSETESLLGLNFEPTKPAADPHASPGETLTPSSQPASDTACSSSRASSPQSTPSSSHCNSTTPPNANLWRRLIHGQSKIPSNNPSDYSDEKPAEIRPGDGAKQSMIARKARAGRKALAKMTGAAITTNRER